MKAKEYYEKHRFTLLNPERGMTPSESYLTNEEYELRQKYRHDQHKSDIYDVFIEFLKDGRDLANSRKVASAVAYRAIISELNQKWNALCDLFQKNDGRNPLPKDYFIEEYRRLEKKVNEEMGVSV